MNRIHKIMPVVAKAVVIFSVVYAAVVMASSEANAVLVTVVRSKISNRKKKRRD